MSQTYGEQRVSFGFKAQSMAPQKFEGVMVRNFGAKSTS